MQLVLRHGFVLLRCPVDEKMQAIPMPETLILTPRKKRNSAKPGRRAYIEDLHKANPDSELRIALGRDTVKNALHDAGNDALGAALRDESGAAHRVGFARAGLPVGEAAGVVALEQAGDERLDTLVEEKAWTSAATPIHIVVCE
jgi:hypothetical protein